MSRQMKDSGIEWIGEIPETWELIRLCNVTDDIFLGRTPVYVEEENQNYIVGQKNNQYYGIDFSGIKYGDEEFYLSRPDKEFLKVGDILLNTLGGGSVGRIGYWDVEDDNKYLTDGHLMVIRPCEHCWRRFLYYAMYSQQKKLEDDAVGSTNQAFLTVTQVYKNLIAYTGLNEQKKIADFLDQQCAHIDAVIEKTKASIEEYKKLKQAVITQAVTKGIRGDRPMKDSGMKWVKKIPADWYSINPKALFTQRKDKAFEGERQLTASQQYGVIYQDEYMEITGTKVVTVEKDFNILKHVESGDFVISMRSFQGGLEYSENTGSISSAYVMLIPNLELVYPRFYKWLLKSSVYINALQSTSDLVRDGQAMRYSNFAQVRLYKVPLEEQVEIADYLDDECSKIDELVKEKSLFLSEIENYKKSLIYEYVTGKKEVPQSCQ